MFLFFSEVSLLFFDRYNENGWRFHWHGLQALPGNVPRYFLFRWSDFFRLSAVKCRFKCRPQNDQATKLAWQRNDWATTLTGDQATTLPDDQATTLPGNQALKKQRFLKTLDFWWWKEAGRSREERRNKEPRETNVKKRGNERGGKRQKGGRSEKRKKKEKREREKMEEKERRRKRQEERLKTDSQTEKRKKIK